MVVITRAMARAAREMGPEIGLDLQERTGSEAYSNTSNDDSDGWETYSRKKRTRSTKKEDPLNDAIETVISMTKMEVDEKREFFIQKVNKTCCSKCGAKGEWVRGKINPKTGAWLWGCGTLMGKTGCGRVIPQNVLFGEALGLEDHKEFRDRMPPSSYRELKSLDVGPVTSAKSLIGNSPEIRDEEQESAPAVKETQCSTTRNGSLMASVIELIAMAINIVKLSTTIEEAKMANSILEQAQMFLRKVDPLEVQEEPKTTRSIFQQPEKHIQPESMKIKTYSAVAKKGGPPNTRRVTPRRMTGAEIEQITTDPAQRRLLAWKALAWKRKAPIGQRMLRGDAHLREGPLKDNIDSMEFVYVWGITRMRYGEARSILRSGGVDTREIRDISFVGKSVCSLLVTKAYKGCLLSSLEAEGSPFKTIPDFDPLSEEHLKRPIATGQIQSPAECYIRRAALAVVNNRKLEVATKYQALLPAELKDKLRTEVQRLTALRGGPKGASKNPSKAPAPAEEQEAMDTDS